MHLIHIDSRETAQKEQHNISDCVTGTFSALTKNFELFANWYTAKAIKNTKILINLHSFIL